MSDADDRQNSEPTKAVGILYRPVNWGVLGTAFGIFMTFGGIASAIAWPAIQEYRETIRRSQCKNGLKQLGLALHNYQNTYSTIPSPKAPPTIDTPAPADYLPLFDFGS